MNNHLKSFNNLFQPTQVFESKHWKNWIAVIDEKTCIICREHHGKVYPLEVIVDVQPPVHTNCRCKILPLKNIIAGNATQDGLQGADYYVKIYGELPDTYISVEEAKILGWKNSLGNLGDIAPGKQLTKGVFYNREGKLPSKPSRIWFEADINYAGGYRNGMRIVFSNDGLIFVTYDHYQTFYEII